MPTYEVKTTYREVSYGKCWVHIEADSEEDARSKLIFGSLVDDYEVVDYRQQDSDEFSLDAEDIYWITQIDKEG